MRLALGIALAGLSIIPASAQDDQIARLNQAMNNLSHEYIQCAAYFSIVSVAMENSARPDIASKYKEVSDAALEYGLGFGEVAGLLPETASARYEMELSSMADRIANNTSNISILGRDYADPCLTAMEDMDSRVDFWMSKEGVIR